MKTLATTGVNQPRFLKQLAHVFLGLLPFLAATGWTDAPPANALPSGGVIVSGAPV